MQGAWNRLALDRLDGPKECSVLSVDRVSKKDRWIEQQHHLTVLKESWYSRRTLLPQGHDQHDQFDQRANRHNLPILLEHWR
jgi:hypothetical protein